MSDGLVYKVIETSEVTDEAIERHINEWVGAGWHFDGIQFAMRESSKRPAMAFLLFTRGVPREPALRTVPDPETDDH